jgi:hypothetical protein
VAEKAVNSPIAAPIAGDTPPVPVKQVVHETMVAVAELYLYYRKTFLPLIHGRRSP